MAGGPHSSFFWNMWVLSTGGSSRNHSHSAGGPHIPDFGICGAFINPSACATPLRPTTLQPAGRNNRSPARQSRVRARSKPSLVRDGTASQPMGGAPLQRCIRHPLSSRLPSPSARRCSSARLFCGPGEHELKGPHRLGASAVALGFLKWLIRLSPCRSVVRLCSFLRLATGYCLFPFRENFGYLRNIAPLFFLRLPSRWNLP